MELENALSLQVKSVPPVASQLHPSHCLRFACPMCTQCKPSLWYPHKLEAQTQKFCEHRLESLDLWSPLHDEETKYLVIAFILLCSPVT